MHPGHRLAINASHLHAADRLGTTPTSSTSALAQASDKLRTLVKNFDLRLFVYPPNQYRCNVGDKDGGYRMHRTRISLEDAQYRRLGAEARRNGISISALIRRIVDDYLGSDRPLEQDPLEAVVGIGSGTGGSIGREHNRYLYGRVD